MDDSIKQGDSRDETMKLADIENLIQQVDIMVGVGEISPFPEEEPPDKGAAAAEEGEGEQSPEPLFGELDEFEALAPPLQFFKKIELTLTVKPGVTLSLHLLRKYSEKNAEVVAAAAGDPAELVGYMGLAVFPGQVLARVVTRDKEGLEVSEEEQLRAEEERRSAGGPQAQVLVEWLGERIEAGAHVVLEGSEFRAERYGYLVLTGERFAVVSPFFVSEDRLQMHWGVFDRRPQAVTPAMLQPWFEEIKIKPALLDVDKVERLLRALGEGEHQRGAFRIAAGEKPVAGIDGRVELLVATERSAGFERPDGSVDFRQVNLLPNVEEGQLIAHRIPPVAGTPGMDVGGAEVPAEGGRDVKVKIDKKTVRSVKEADVELFYAARPGAVRFDGKALSVVNIYSLNNGVNYETGNIDFAGEVFVQGSIAEGFSVRAGGDVTVTETVADGAEIVSESGSVTVGRGVVGRRSKITAGKTVRVQFVHDAAIRAGGDIVIGNYLYNANIFAGGSVEIRKGEGVRGGSILGGKTVAIGSMTLWSAGSPSWVATELAVGFDPDAAANRERVEAAIGKTSRHLHRILDVFGLPRLEPDLIRAKVVKASGTQRKFLEQQAKLLGQLAKSYKALLEMRQALREAASEVKTTYPRIKVQGTAYPGLTIKIGAQTLKLDREHDAVVFKKGEKGIETI